MAKKSLDREAAFRKLLRAWRKRYVDVTIEFMAQADERRQVAKEVERVASRNKLRRIAAAEVCVCDVPVIQVLTYHCGRTPTALGRQIMGDVLKVNERHPGVEFHFKFTTRV